MLQPKKTKYRKAQRGVIRGLAIRGSNIAFGDFALKVTESGYITARQIEASRRTIVRYLKKWGRVWIRIFPDKPFTTKPLEVPMGWGKGWLEMYRAPVRPGRILFEISGIPQNLAQEALMLASHKLPLKTKFVTTES